MTCETCHVELQIGMYPFCKGHPEDHGPGSGTVIGDACDFVVHHGTRHPIRFRSKAEYRAWRTGQGLELRESHVPLQGTDKSPFTSNWGSRMDPYTANNVRILMERAFQAGVTEEDATVPVRVDIHDMSQDEVARYV